MPLVLCSLQVTWSDPTPIVLLPLHSPFYSMHSSHIYFLLVSLELQAHSTPGPSFGLGQWQLFWQNSVSSCLIWSQNLNEIYRYTFLKVRFSVIICHNTYSVLCVCRPCQDLCVHTWGIIHFIFVTDLKSHNQRIHFCLQLHFCHLSVQHSADLQQMFAKWMSIRKCNTNLFIFLRNNLKSHLHTQEFTY